MIVLSTHFSSYATYTLRVTSLVSAFWTTIFPSLLSWAPDLQSAFSSWIYLCLPGILNPPGLNSPEEKRKSTSPHPWNGDLSNGNPRTQTELILSTKMVFNGILSLLVVHVKQRARTEAKPRDSVSMKFLPPPFIYGHSRPLVLVNHLEELRFLPLI